MVNSISFLFQCKSCYTISDTGYNMVSRYNQKNRTYCSKDGEFYSTLEDAKNDCSQHKSCIAINDSRCQGKRFWICTEHSDMGYSNLWSCIWKKGIKVLSIMKY